ncbi:carbohydrate ABC transporter ATP-binding protein, CUT1 family [Pseudooceanicola antarcticus]|uniref:Carbohydrate ABC transporter ATP-binding protein, CUT1 family n=1 Tax=Pseudooceanicola antarcticus TaxID=1247613 RepID=A0A285JCL7_9RHOB|nr:sn-glycerol-3-phosphate ABC transporter ATP-binding protein UgpC [Pseudooceanicola antarcticus]PJE30917.1 sn-glycerol-3-phosphate ABC transporter ATP-binding protein UgpC [Pseudooceanicola antarcticus]SNY57833.1 carbohydrate ABC transporter ATP-binding protein, CUT1 family [Pseudooceanicola antarcticus]
MAELQLRGVEKTYGNGFKAVHGINLDVEEGEFMVLVGPSGCAKSTTLRMIAGLETITGGEVRIGEQVVNDLVPGRRGIAMVFQNYALYPHMKVRRNLSFGLKLKRKPKAEIETATEEVSGILEIEQLLDRLPKQLSGGQAQRVALGRALIKHPEVFLFDEPLSNLDAKLRASMRVRITDLHKRLRSEGRPATVVYVTHDQVEAMTMGDRICVMKDGHIMQVADPTTLYERPANDFVAGFIGMPEMNLVKCTLTHDGALPVLTAGSQKITVAEGLASRLSAQEGPVTLGIRPQHLQVVAADEANAFTGTVSNIEFLGHEVNLHVEVEGAQFVVVVPSAELDKKIGRGDQVGLRPLGANIHIFDAESGANVSLPAD